MYKYSKNGLQSTILLRLHMKAKLPSHKPDLFPSPSQTTRSVKILPMKYFRRTDCQVKSLTFLTKQFLWQ